jgi:C_GCAxxG_C_C family probable redox protein
MKEIQEKIISDIGRKAEELYLSKQLLCSESVLVALNSGLGQPIEKEMAINLMAAFPGGIGNSGCLCGALTGGLTALGIVLGKRFSRKEVRAAAQDLHNQFTQKYKVTCCRVLIKGVKGDPKAHFEQCSKITGHTAELAARLLFELKPSLLEKADQKYLAKKEKLVIVKRLLAFINKIRG